MCEDRTFKVRSLVITQEHVTETPLTVLETIEECEEFVREEQLATADLFSYTDYTLLVELSIECETHGVLGPNILDKTLRKLDGE